MREQERVVGRILVGWWGTAEFCSSGVGDCHECAQFVPTEDFWALDARFLEQGGFGFRSGNDKVGEFEDVDDLNGTVLQPFDGKGSGLIVEASEQDAFG